MNTKFLQAAALMAALVFTQAVSHADVVNIDFEGSGASTYSGQGAYADAGNDYWNSSQDGMTSLITSDGVSTTAVSVAVSPLQDLPAVLPAVCPAITCSTITITRKTEPHRFPLAAWLMNSGRQIH